MSLASLEFEEVERFTRAFEALFNAGDAAGMASNYTEDARLLAEHADLVRGRGAIERFWREAISPGGPELTTKYATIWQRDPDRRWRLAVDSSSPNP
jgi:ketosteroid isomerase-like protein